VKKQPKKVIVGEPSKRQEDEGWGVGLLDVVFPFFLPMKGVIWIGKKFKEAADVELTNKSKVQEELLDLQMHFEMGQVDEEEYKKEETKLLERLEAIRKYEERRKERS